MTDEHEKLTARELLQHAYEEVDHSFDHAMDHENDDDVFESFANSVVGRLRRIRRIALSNRNANVGNKR